jgi:hypothetical protein
MTAGQPVADAGYAADVVVAAGAKEQEEQQGKRDDEDELTPGHMKVALHHQ